MQILVIGGKRDFVINIPRPDRKIMLFHIPKDKLWELKADMEQNLRDQLMFSYPIGNFQALAYRDIPYGEQPRWEAYNQVTPVPGGLVLEIVDVMHNERARSMPIPWELFAALENPSKVWDLQW